MRLLGSAKSLPLPLANPVEIDGAVLLFTTVVSVIAGLLFGLAPALQNSERGLSEELKAGAQSVLGAGGSRGRLRDVLVVAEIAMTVALLVGAGLLLRSFARLRTADIGVNPDHVLTAFINLPEMRYGTLAKRRLFFDTLVERVRSTPGVEDAAISTEIPLEGGNNGYIQVDGKTSRTLAGQLVEWNFTTSDYFRTFGIPVVAGRTFNLEDANRTAANAERLFAIFNAAKGGAPKIPADLSLDAVINRAMARAFWQGTDPIGKSFHWNGVTTRVIGVVGDVKEHGIRAEFMPQAYFPLSFSLVDNGQGHLTVKTRTAAKVALLLAAVGLYGVMSYLVTRRTREIGIRMALGATRESVLQLIFWEGTKLTLAGILFGTLAAFALTRSLSSLLYGVTASDPITFAAVIALLGVVALTSYFIPALRATKVDPILALRYE